MSKKIATFAITNNNKLKLKIMKKENTKIYFESCKEDVKKTATLKGRTEEEILFEQLAKILQVNITEKDGVYVLQN